jgi:hypothetical protein
MDETGMTIFEFWELNEIIGREGEIEMPIKQAFLSLFRPHMRKYGLSCGEI